MLEARGASPRRGAITIRVLGLNLRDQLQQRRLGKILQVKALLTEVLHNAERRDEVLATLCAMRDGKGEYTASVRAVLHELSPIIQVFL